MPNSNMLLELTARLAKALAIELDLHYLQSDSKNITEEIEGLRLAQSVLVSHNFPPIAVVDHVITRFVQ